MLDLEQLGVERRRWVRLGGALEGVEVEVRHAGPRSQEKFRQKLQRDGVIKNSDSGYTINPGREDAFFREYAERFITDWRGDIRLGDTKNPPYDHEKMGKVLGAYSVAFEQLVRALSDEADFFSENGSASTP